MPIPMNNWTATVVLVLFFTPHTLYVLRRNRREARWEAARQLRTDRLRNCRGDGPFHPQLVPTPERQQVTDRGGMTCEQWYSAAVADFMASRRRQLPSCAEFRREFGTALLEFYVKQRSNLRLPDNQRAVELDVAAAHRCAVDDHQRRVGLR